MKRKLLIIFSHLLPRDQWKTLPNGDVYDSYAELYQEKGGKLLYRIPLLNVDSTQNVDNNPNTPEIDKVEVANGRFAAIVGDHKGKYKALLFITEEGAASLKDWHGVTEKMRTLPGRYPNYVHNGALIVKYANYHIGGETWDYSLGCMTSPIKPFKTAMSYLEYNEILDVEKV